MSPKLQLKVEKIVLPDELAAPHQNRSPENLHRSRSGQITPLRGHPLEGDTSKRSEVSPFAKRAPDVMRPEASLANLQMMRKVKGN
jgi:hypothetical protein